MEPRKQKRKTEVKIRKMLQASQAARPGASYELWGK